MPWLREGQELEEATGKCVLCSRTCVRCGAKIGRAGCEICSLCLVKDRRAAAQQPCPRCGKPGRIREATGWCGHCSHPGRTPSPDAACRACGLITHREGDGLCLPCYTKSPHRITVRAENLAAQLGEPPGWLAGFADYLVPRHNASAACRRMVLTDPAKTITIAQPWGFRSPSLTVGRQRELFRRWTSGTSDVHPHDALTGLLALIHGATTQEIRHLTVEATAPAAETVTLRGRPHPTPLDPWTRAAAETCLAHRQALNSTNPCLLVTLQTRATRAPSGDSYVKNVLAPAGGRQGSCDHPGYSPS